VVAAQPLRAPDGQPAGPQANGSVRVFLVDDHQLLRDGLRMLISGQPNMDVCGEAEDEASARRQIAEAKPDLAVVDLTLKNESGLDLIKWLKAHHPTIRVIVATMHEEKVYGERALRAGASGYVNKHDPSTTILKAIREVMAGGVFFSEPLVGRLIRRAAGRNPEEAASAINMLSDRELQVFRMLGQGKNSAEVADALFLSRSTVDTYRERLKDKLGCKSSSELVFQAIQWAMED
jgi:DNA-binding NarL/FixJ family response regulator